MSTTRRDLLRRLAALPFAGAATGLLGQLACSASDPSPAYAKKGGAPEPRVCRPTQKDLLGPFYRKDAPVRSRLVPQGEPGEPLVLRGRVLAAGACTPLDARVTLDVWQADAKGRYDNDSNAFRGRGRILPGADGAFEIHTIRPGHYPEGGSWRPRHLHLAVWVEGRRQPLVTQIYFAGDKYLGDNDPCGVCSSDDEARIIALTKSGSALSGGFDLVV